MRKITGGLLPVDTWKDYMRAAHKGLKNRPLSAPDPLINDPEILHQIAFYDDLAEAFTLEREMASGAKSSGGPPRSAGR